MDENDNVPENLQHLCLDGDINRNGVILKHDVNTGGDGGQSKGGADRPDQTTVSTNVIQDKDNNANGYSKRKLGYDETEDRAVTTVAESSSEDRPISTAVALPLDGQEHLTRPSTSSATDTDGDRSHSKASQSGRAATANRDGRKSVTFADRRRNTTNNANTPELPAEEDVSSEKGGLFATAVSEDKIQEAVARKMKSISSGSSTPVSELQEQAQPALDILNERANEHYDRGCKLSDTGDFAAAITAFDRAINLCPEEVVYYLMRGEMYLELTDFQSAIQNFKKVCVLRPPSDIHYSKLAFVYYLQGQSLFDQCLYAEALESFSRAAEMRPENIGYQTRSMACLAALGRHGECLALVNKKLEEDQSNPDLYIMRARLHLIFRNTLASDLTPKQFMLIMRNIPSLPTKYASPFHDRILCYYDVKDALTLDREQLEAQRLMAELEGGARDCRDLAVRLQLQGKLKESLMKMGLAIEMDPAVAEFHLLRGAIHRRLHDFNAAIDDFLLALDKTDHNESDRVYRDSQRQLLLTYNDFAVDCFLGGHFDEAILLLNKALKGEKREKGLYVNRGDCFFRLGELHFSLADYHQALELDPPDLLVRGRIAAIHGEFGSIDYEEHSYQDAEARFTVAIQHSPKNSRFYLSRAKVRFMLENHSGARQDIMISLHLEPTNDAIHSLLARLFPGKTVAEVMKGKSAKEAKIALENAIVIASPVKLPDIALRLTKSESAQSLVKEGFTPEAPVDDKVPTSTFVLFMSENEFNKVLARKKKMIATDVKSSLQDRQSLRRVAPKLKPQPPPRDFELRGGHWKMNDTKPPPGWRQFGLGIEMKEAR